MLPVQSVPVHKCTVSVEYTPYKHQIVLIRFQSVIGENFRDCVVWYSPILSMSLLGTKRNVSLFSYSHISHVSRPNVSMGSESAFLAMHTKPFRLCS